MFEKKEIRLILYYFALLALYIISSNYPIEAGSVVRLIVLGLIVGPLFLRKSEWLPPVIVIFSSLANINYVTPFLPTVNTTYLVVLLLGLVISRPGRKKVSVLPLVLLTIFTFLTNFLQYGACENITETLLIIILFFYYTPFFEEKQIVVFSYSFVLISLVVVISTAFLGSNYTMTYELGYEGLDRTVLADPNYSACVVGMGIVCGLIALFSGYAKHLVIKIGILVIMVASLFVLSANASRTSFLAIAASGVVLLMYSKIKIGYKLLFCLLVGAVIVYMYNNAYFDILQYRIENDEGGGSNRLIIWAAKFDAFSQGNIFNYLFGFGYEPGRELGTGEAFHNDFIAFLVEYGIIGLIMLVSLFIVPFKRCGFKNAPALACLVYMFVVSVTLEPFAAGRLPYYAFWLYTLMLSVQDNDLKFHK